MPKHPERFLWRANVAVRKDRNRHGVNNLGDGVVLCRAEKAIGSGAPVHRQSRNARILSKAGKAHAIAMFGAPTRANLQGDWDGNSGHRRLQNLRDQPSSFNRADPAALLHTFFAGHPMLISMICALPQR